MFKLFIIIFILVLAGEPFYNRLEQAYVNRENRVPRQVKRTIQGTVSAAMTLDAWCWIYNKRRGVTDSSVSSCARVAFAGASVSGAVLTTFWSEQDWQQLARIRSSLGESIWDVAGASGGGEQEKKGTSTA